MSFSSTPVKDSLVVFTEGAKVNFKMWGHVAPVFGANIDGEPKLFPVVFQKVADKEAFRQMILGMIASGKLREFVFVAEAWLADATDPEDVRRHLAEHGSLESYPGRREAIQVLYSSPDEEICYTASINRGSMGVTLGEWEKTTRSGFFQIPDLTTRFQGLFAQGKAGNN